MGRKLLCSNRILACYEAWGTVQCDGSRGALGQFYALQRSSIDQALAASVFAVMTRSRPSAETSTTA